MTGKFKQGHFVPKHPEKYKGNSSNIVFRSSYEYALMKFLDEQANVLEWSSEEKFIRYHNPVTRRVSRYFPDVIAKIKNKQGIVENVMIEVKPKSKLVQPIKSPRGSEKSYHYNLMNYMVNMAKFEAADKYCNNHNMKFQILTEDDLFGSNN